MTEEQCAENRYIEVVGSAKYELTAIAFPLELTFTSASKGRVDRYKLSKAVDGFVVALEEQGFDLNKLSHGGSRDTKRYWGSRQLKSELVLRMMCETAQEAADLNSACAQIPHEGAELALDAKVPVFEEGSDKRSSAFAKATKNAQKSAGLIAQTAGAQLGRIVFAREMNDAARGSGYGSDTDWGEHNIRSALVAGAGGGSPHAQPGGDVHTARVVNLLVRFELK
ncbi:SIMPL domain-containing protein [Roseovarius rhodophyticola]|uniref:SIMPL domain-containing protein n=1 Tax=Roseovarius rhodophyticola TaxID=3080827 RepID=A0ABZ2TE16_9RHOB|nr:SIMPL domain-containing protein [Roseovarius sp. W115]MDV2930359.1 SIMPL domain-containing protein [Roseovarius sp. W115]